MKPKYVATIISILCVFSWNIESFAHSGGLDENGGHYNRKTGEYHSHRKPSTELKLITPVKAAETYNRTPISTPKSEQIRSRSSEHKLITLGKTTDIHESTLKSTQVSKITNSISAADREKIIGNYFRNANENVGALDCGVMTHARDVNEATKDGVKWGYGNKCIICGSTVKLEVDHRRALMNGGTNDVSNLALLCDDCHKIKTKYDNSLRRKRESVCRRK